MKSNFLDIMALTELADIGCVIINDDNNVVYANSYIETILGFTLEDLLGKNISVIVPSPHREQHDHYIKKFERTKKANVIGYTRFVQAVTKEGHTLDISLNVNAISLLNQKYYIGFINRYEPEADKKTNDSLANFTNIIELQALIYDEQSDVYDYKQLLGLINSLVIRLTKSEYGFIGMVIKDAKSGARHLKNYNFTNIASGDETSVFYNNDIVNGLEFRNLNTLFDYSLRTGSSFITNDAIKYFEAVEVSKGHSPLNTYMGVTLYYNGDFIGMYCLTNRKEGYSQKIVNALVAVNQLAAKVLYKVVHADKIALKVANLDELTGALNRKAFLNTASTLIHQNKPINKCYFLSLNIKDFKNYNSHYGLHFGDQILVEITKQLIKRYGIGNVFRVNGDEFMVFIPLDRDISAYSIDISYLNNIRVLGKNIILVIKYCLIDCSRFLIEQVTNQQILEYHAIGQTYLQQHNKYKLEINFDNFTNFKDNSPFANKLILERCFNEDLFFINLQPFFNDARQVTGFEVLLRLNYGGKVYAPGSFINYVYNLGYSERVNILVVNKLMAILKTTKWQKIVANNDLKISLNVTPFVNNLAQHVNDLVGIICSYQINLGRSFYQFEFTEEDFISDQFLNNIEPMLSVFKKFGIKIAMDDFGVKYSSLKRLLDYKFDELKIDMSFVQSLDMEGDKAKTSNALVRSIISFAMEVGIHVTAEGVETEAQFAHLKALGCNSFQGYLFGKPTSVDNFLANFL